MTVLTLHPDVADSDKKMLTDYLAICRSIETMIKQLEVMNRIEEASMMDRAFNLTATAASSYADDVREARLG